MADYWKSNPRKFCDVCKCWFGDNKASVDFHERGKRHQENVKKLLSSRRPVKITELHWTSHTPQCSINQPTEAMYTFQRVGIFLVEGECMIFSVQARQKTADNEKKAKETDRMLATIEMAATIAYERDLEEKHGELPTSRQTKSFPAAPQLQDTPTETFHERKAKAHLEILQTIQNHQEKVEREAAKKAPPPPPSLWQQVITPGGRAYYYNIFTRETQWEQPADFQPAPNPPQLSSTTAAHSPLGKAAEEPSLQSTTVASEDREQLVGKKRTSENESDIDTGIPVKRPAGPYGGWTTVSLHPRQPEAEEEESDSNHDTDSDEDDGREEEERLSFGERTVDSVPPHVPARDGGVVTPGSFKGFSFKKRSIGRPQIRQRTRELS